MRLRVIVFALVATAVAVGLVLPSASARPKPVKPGQFVTYTCASGETAGSGTVAWFDKDGQVISVSTATASGATLTAGPAPARAKSYEWRSVICIPPPTTTTVAATTTSSSTTTTTIAPTTTSSSTTTTVAPTTTSSSTTTTTVAPTTTTVPDPTIHLTGSFMYPTDGEFYFIYGGDPSLGFPVCPAGTSLDLDASVIDLPADVTLHNFLDSAIPSLIVETPYIDTTGNGDYETRTITYDYACVPA
jgi:hypothetical protein